MKMMLIMSLFFCLINAHASVWSEMNDAEKNEAHSGIRDGKAFDIRLRVVDDEGVAVEGVQCGGWMFLDRAKDSGVGYQYVTDKNGEVRIAGKCGEWVSVVLRKEGYYMTKFKVNFPIQAHPPIVDGMWQPYGEERTVVLKKIRNPCKMHGGGYREKRNPKIFDQWIGFDLEKGEFLPPMGKGRDADMLVRFHQVNRANDDWSVSMEISFTNYPYAGAYRASKDVWSDMKSSYLADTNAIYQANFNFKFNHEKGVRPYAEKLQEDEYLVFRTRTRVDKEGRLISARYGKIYGPWDFENPAGACINDVFMNDLDNDLNLEDLWTVERAKKMQERRKSR